MTATPLDQTNSDLSARDPEARRTNVKCRRASRLIAALLTAVIVSLSGAQAIAADADEIRSTLFAEATGALKAANKARASLLAPVSYSEASDSYRRAEELLKEGSSLEAIRRNLRKAADSFNEASEAASKAAENFSGPLAARAAAVDANAEQNAADDWKAGEVALAEAAQRLENGRESSAAEYAADAEEKYRSGELTAIKSSYLRETRDLLSQAKKLRADRYATKTYDQAKSLLSQAETQLEEDRYDTDRPRNLARQAKHEAYHAIYLARIGNEVRKGDRSTEDVLLDWEASLRRLGDVMDTPLYFDNGETAAVNTLISKVNDMNALVERLAQDLGEREAQVAALDGQVNQLNEKLGGEAAAVQSLNAILQAQELHRQRFSQLENSYLLTEAEVLRQGNDVILRMVGLTFDSGSDDIKPEHAELLQKLSASADVFPRATLSIEGHTDAYGSDTANLKLSEQRAQAIKTYLTEETGLDGLRLSSVGYGESQPVANNETAEGRAKNRRIDIVITPFEEL